MHERVEDEMEVEVEDEVEDEVYSIVSFNTRPFHSSSVKLLLSQEADNTTVFNLIKIRFSFLYLVSIIPK